jgi:GAF domain-containing protein
MSFETNLKYPKEKNARYQMLLEQSKAMVDGERNQIANLANVAALLFHGLEEINWAGFYLLDDRELVLGPFQGKPACIRIPIGRGVCGTAVAQRKTQRIENVHDFPGHIACDSASNSEIVIPILVQDRVVGVLDIDSPVFHRFQEEDQQYLEEIVHVLEQCCDWPKREDL